MSASHAPTQLDYEPAAGGHGYGKDNKERAGFQVLGFRFLKSKIGWLGDEA
jgi:prolyl oligopeptidase